MSLFISSLFFFKIKHHLYKNGSQELHYIMLILINDDVASRSKDNNRTQHVNSLLSDRMNVDIK